MSKLFKKFLSIMIICSLVLTTNAVWTFADGLNSETTESVEASEESVEASEESVEESEESVEESEESVGASTASPEKETESTVGASTRPSELLSSESEESATKSPWGTSPEEETEETSEYTEEPEEETTVEETTVEETTVEETTIEETTVEETTAEETTESTVETSEDNVGASTTSPEKETEPTVGASTASPENETDPEDKMTTIEEATASELEKKDALLGDGENYTFAFKMQDDFGWYNSEDGDTKIEYDSSDDIVIPVVYPAGGHSAGYVWIDDGWAKDVGGRSGPTMTENQLQELINNWKTNPTEDIAIYPNFEHFYKGNIKTPPSKLDYTVGQKIDLTGIVFELTKDEKEKEVPYALPQYKRLYSVEILNADKEVLGGDTVTADTKYCRFHFDDMIYEDVELDVTVPRTFKFVKDTKFKAWFNQEDGPTEITFKSEELATNPVVIPKTYISKDEGGTFGVVNVGWRNKTASEKWISDDELRELIYNWSKNPNEDVVIAVNFDIIGEASVKTPPNKVDYFEGDEFDPTGFVMYLAGGYVGATWTVEVAYDAPEYQRIIGVQLYDNNDKKISGRTITADTKFVRFTFNSGQSADVNINLRTPQTFTFEVSDSFAHFNAEDGPTTIEYKSEELSTKAIRIPAVYMNRSVGGDVKINVGWINNSDGDKKITDAELEKIVMDWTKNPDSDMKISVNFETVEEASAKVLPRVEYWLGGTFEPWEFVLEVSDSNKTWTKEIPLDSPQYGRLYTYKLLDENKQEVQGFDITLETKYCSITYDDTITKEFDIVVLKEVREISLKQPQDWKEYSTGEQFDPRGLEIHVTYADDEEEDVAYNDKRVLFLFDPFYLREDTSEVTVFYGGKTTTTHVTMFNKVYVLYYYNSATDSVHSIPTYPGDENNVLSALDNAMSSGAKGFYRVDANGFYDGYKKYNKDTISTLTKYQALSVYTEEYDGNESLYIGAAFIEPPAPPEPTPRPKPTPKPSGDSGSSGGGGGGSSDPTRGPMGDLTKNPAYQQLFMQTEQLNTTNNIPQNKLFVNTQLALTLLASAENANIPMSNVTDAYGNKGFGKWLKVPGTNTWYLLTGDINANGASGSAGFAANGLYYTSWRGTSGLYCFSATGEMLTGWQQIDGKTYYFEPNPNDTNYGKATIGSRVINGQTFNFDANGALVG